MMTATYSPEDNKLRLSSTQRLDPELYKRVRAAGFIWAPKQGIFVAPMWTPSREDLLIELCGEIGDEDTSLVERAEERAERFEGYSESRAEDAEAARAAVAAIADNIPFGQPILVGHHSERHARKDAERIQNDMRKAVKMWETSQYWEDRAKGAIRHAKYKELPAVRARRIKTIEADKRKQERYKAEAEAALHLWTECANEQDKDLQLQVAIRIAGTVGRLSMPRKEGDRPDFDQRPDAYTALTNAYPSLYAPRTIDEVLAVALKPSTYPASIARYERWIRHYKNRIAYERAMLAESGGIATDQKGPQKGGGCKCWASHRGGWSYIHKVNKVSVTVLDNWGNGGRNFTRTIPFDKLSAIMTPAEVQAARTAGVLVEASDGTGYFMNDSVTPRGADDTRRQSAEAKPQAEQFEQLRETIKAGVQVVTAPQLFPTPRELAARMVDLAEIGLDSCVLEPSAGTGAILDQVYTYSGEIVAVEINQRLADSLAEQWKAIRVVCGDFLEQNGNLGTFDRVLMNPPFKNGEDIKHILHARHFLKPGGRIVALCADGPRQNEQLKPLATFWESLPADTFKDQGTGVRAALLVIS